MRAPPISAAGVCGLLILSAGPWLPAPRLSAQAPEVPRTRTFSGLVAPHFPYARPEEVGLSTETLNRIGDEITEWIGGDWIYSGELVGAELLVVKDGKAVFHEAYGWSDRERQLPMRRNSIFSIKSMSKPFTATAVLMLVDERRLSLDDPVREHIPAFVGDPRTTIRHLLSHTSGYREEVGDPGPRHATLADWVEEWAANEPTGTFGEFAYSDFNFGALGYIVGAVSGSTIDVFTQERIIDPLGLEDTSTGFSDDPVWRARLNPWYRWNDDYRAYDLRWPTSRDPWEFYTAAWGMFSTALDYARFMALWINGGELDGVRLLSERLVEDALKAHGRVGGLGVYGYGWFVDDTPAEEGGYFAHGGGDGTMAEAFPASHAMVVYMNHSREGPHHEALMNRIHMSGLFEHPGMGPAFTSMVWAHEADLAVVELPADERSLYEGTFAATRPDEAPYEVLQVRDDGGVLHLRLGDSGSKADLRYHLVPLGGHAFAVGRYEDGQLRGVDPTHTVRFVVEEDVVIGLDLMAADRVLVSGVREHTRRR